MWCSIVVNVDIIIIRQNRHRKEVMLRYNFSTNCFYIGNCCCTFINVLSAIIIPAIRRVRGPLQPVGVQAGHRAVLGPQRRATRREHLEQHTGRGGGRGARARHGRREIRLYVEQTDYIGQGVCQHWALLPLV